jgi:hypothetical protein
MWLWCLLGHVCSRNASPKLEVYISYSHLCDEFHLSSIFTSGVTRHVSLAVVEFSLFFLFIQTQKLLDIIKFIYVLLTI